MALMKKMRENTKTILLIVVFAFILTIIIDWGAGGLKTGPKPGVIGVVNGDDILHEDFSKSYRQQLAAHRERTGTDPEGYQLTSIENQVWEGLVQQYLLMQVVNARGIKAGNQEIVDEIYINPPEFLRRNESFQNEDGVFDREKYNQALEQGSSEFWLMVENYLKGTLPFQKLDNRIRATVRITDGEAKNDFIENKIKAKVDYILYDSNRFKDANIEISDSEYEVYYQEHQEDFQQVERRKLDYVLFEIKATPKDSAETKSLAKELLEQAQSGENFAELAETYSADAGSASKGGDLGYFGKGAMVKPFEDAAFAARVGEIVGPVESRFGLHIIKVEDKKKEDGELKVKASHILLKFEASVSTREALNNEASYLSEYAEETDLQSVVAAESLEVLSTDFFQKGLFIPGIGMEHNLSRWTFTNKVGKVSDVIYTNKGYIVAGVAEIEKEHIKPFEDVKAEIERRLRAEKRMNLAGEKCLAAYKKTQSGYAFDQVAAEDSLEIKNVDSFTMAGYVPGVGREPAFIGAAFALNVGEISKPVEGTKGYYLIQLLEKDEFDQKAFEGEKEQTKNKLLAQRRQSIYGKWYNNLKENSEIKDFRDVYYF